MTSQVITEKFSLMHRLVAEIRKDLYHLYNQQVTQRVAMAFESVLEYFSYFSRQGLVLLTYGKVDSDSSDSFRAELHWT